jgi:rhodanese-related sulfurtransferase
MLAAIDCASGDHMAQTTTEPTIHELSATELHSMLGDDDVMLVDVREPDESVKSRIEGAVLRPLSAFDPLSLPSDATRIVLHCHSGRRSAEAAQMLMGAGRAEVWQLRGGIEAWKRAGLPVIGNARAPISIMRQVQITAGLLVLVGLALGVLVWPWFLLISAFIGAGLMFAGTSGCCGMAAVLARMPWNRVFRPAPKRS